jgi:hypothetical protein
MFLFVMSTTVERRAEELRSDLVGRDPAGNVNRAGRGMFKDRLVVQSVPDARVVMYHFDPSLNRYFFGAPLSSG